MPAEEIPEALGERLEEDNFRPRDMGEYHPSTISGCPLKSFLSWMTENRPELNHWMFEGSAVHHYLQERPELLTQALYDAGYHPLDTGYEISNRTKVGDGIHIVGTCDILTEDDENSIVIDMKYSSVQPGQGRNRIYKYASQVNTYANMFGTDEWALLLIYSRADNIPEELTIISNETDEENYDMIKSKAKTIHSALKHYEFHRQNRWEMSELEKKIDSFWEDVMEHFDKQQCPSYDGECKYCDHKSYCPVYQGKLGGLQGLGK